MKPGYLSEIFVSFQGEGLYVGERHLFVRLAGCHLRCRYCDTPGSLERTQGFVVHSAQGSKTYDNPVDPQVAAAIVLDVIEAEGPIDAIAVTGGEPLTQPRFLVDLFSHAQFAVPVLLETSGTLPKPLAEVLPYVDIVSMDIKLPSNSAEAPFWAEHAEFLRVASGKTVYAKIPVDDATQSEDFTKAIDLLRATPTVPVFLQPIMSELGVPMIAMARLAALQKEARSHLERVRVVPQTHKFLSVR